MLLDPALAAAIATSDPEALAEVLASMSDEDILTLLGETEVSEEEEIPDNPIAQAQEINPGYRSMPHLDYLSGRLADAVRRVEAGEDVKMLVSMPPRMGKTELISIYLPLWILRRRRETKVGIISHSPNLSTSWGRRIRREVERHGPRLGLSIAPDAGAVSEWETPQGGGVTSRSIGQALAGVGFNVLIVDDPTRDFQAAHSEAARDAVWSWWLANAVTRLEPPSLVIVVQTRWHEDDLTGRLLSTETEGDPSEWEQVILPAIADHDPEKGETDALGREPGEPLYSPLVKGGENRAQAIKRWDSLRRDVGSYTWTALYMQRPAPAAGAILNTGWWRYWTSDPAKATPDGKIRYLDPSLSGARVIDSWDATFKATSSSDFVVGQRWARIGANNFLIDQCRDRLTFTQTIAKMKAWAKSGLGWERVHERLIEDKANGPAIIDSLRDSISGIKPVEPQGSKEARARAITPEIESGNVYLPLPTDPGMSWVSDFLTEAQSFPTGKHDDQVDAMTQALSALRPVGRSGVSIPGRRDGQRGQTAVTRRRIDRNIASMARSELSRRRG